MSDKTLKTRIQHKNGLPAEWEQATNFVPLKGELIIYNDATAPKIKIGDGSTLVGNLPFVGASITMNGAVASSPSFYAPTSAGTSGQVLKSNGSGAPSWITLGNNAYTSTEYLPLSGGTITASGHSTPLTLKSGTQISSYLKFISANDTTLGWIGFESQDDPVISYGSTGSNYSILHENNYSDYVKTLAYPNQLTTDAAIDNFNYANSFRVATWNNTSSPGVSNGMILNMGWVGTSYGAQIAIDDDPTYYIALRQKDENGWKAWKRIPMADGTGASGTWPITSYSVRDNGDGRTLYFNYSADGMTNDAVSWIAVWNGSTLQCINKSALKVGGAVNADYINVIATNEVRFNGLGSQSSLWFHYVNPDETSATTALTDYFFGNGQKLANTTLHADLFTGKSYYVRDVVNGSQISLTYGENSRADSEITFLGAWDGYKLTNIKKTELTVGRALKDGNGNTISSTYLPLSGGTISGNLTFQAATSGTSPQNQRITINGVANSTAVADAPGIGFHTGSVGWATIKCVKSSFYFYDSSCSGYVPIYGSQVYGAVWNDYAEYRTTVPNAKPGQVVIENGDGSLRLSTERLQPGCEVVSDTFGFAIGETDNCKTPIAASGRVLAYTYEDRDTFIAGEPVCSGPNGTISRMTREEAKEYPERIIGTVSEIPTYETWGTGNVEVNGRIWIRIR